MGITIRQATPKDTPGIARVHVDSWRTTYSGVLPEEFFSGLSYANRENLWRDSLSTAIYGKSHCVAESSDGDIVGFSVSGPESEGNSEHAGEIYAIYLLAGYQRLGVGRRLFLASCSSLQDAGIGSMLLWVLEENHRARRFYESLGGKLVARKDVTIGGAEVVEVAYGWNDITKLLP